MATTERVERPPGTDVRVLDHGRPARDGDAAPAASLRWALAPYAPFAFLPFGTAVALWLEP